MGWSGEIDTITARIDATTRIPDSHRAEVIPAPRSIKIELTNRCNYSCSMCGLRGRETPGRDDIDLDLFRRVTREAYGAGVREYGLFYIGESTIAPELLVACLKHVRSLGHDTYAFLTTNGSLLDPVLAERLMASGLDSLKFSINATTPEDFEDAMGVKSKLFWRALDNLRAAWHVRAKGGYGTRLYASSIRFHVDPVAETQQSESFLQQWVIPYVDEHYWLPLFKEMQNPRAEENLAKGWKPNAGNQGRLDAMVPPVPCWAVFTEAHLRVDGNLSACCFGADDRFDMGDLNRLGFMAGWNSPKFRALRRAHLSGDVHGTVCEGCIHG